MGVLGDASRRVQGHDDSINFPSKLKASAIKKSVPNQSCTSYHKKGAALLKQEACIYPFYKGIAVAKISKLYAG